MAERRPPPYAWVMMMANSAVIDLDAFREFREGLAKLRDGEADAALKLLRLAMDRDPENPYYVSYYGLSLAHAEGRWQEAEHFCHTAVCRSRRQAQLYLNLAEVYANSGRPQGAADTLARGLRYLPTDPRLQAAFGRLATRRLPIVKFLPRTHIINRGLGQLRHNLVQLMPRRKQLIANESNA